MGLGYNLEFRVLKKPPSIAIVFFDFVVSVLYKRLAGFLVLAEESSWNLCSDPALPEARVLLANASVS